MRERRVIIVGAGIGGLTAAIALRRVGIEAQVFERAPELREAGAGISLWPNAVLPLRRLGVGEAIEAAGYPSTDSSLRSWTGEPLGPAVADRLEGTFGAPLVVVHRAALQGALRAALPPDAVELGHEAVAIEQDGAGAAVHFSSGSHERGDLVVGADGIRSRVRAAVISDGEPRYSGHTAWRGVVSMDPSLANQVLLGESWGPASLFGVARLGGSQAYWWASVRAGKTRSGTADEEKDALLRRFARWHPTVSALIEATVPEAIIRTPLYDRRPSARWTERPRRAARRCGSPDAAQPRPRSLPGDRGRDRVGGRAPCRSGPGGRARALRRDSDEAREHDRPAVPPDGPHRASRESTRRRREERPPPRVDSERHPPSTRAPARRLSTYADPRLAGVRLGGRNALALRSAGPG